MKLPKLKGKELLRLRNALAVEIMAGLSNFEGMPVNPKKLAPSRHENKVVVMKQTTENAMLIIGKWLEQQEAEAKK